MDVAVKRRPRPDSKQHLHLRRRQLTGPADGVQREIHHLRRHRQPPERLNVYVYLQWTRICYMGVEGRLH